MLPFHQSGRVKISGVSEEGPARAVYNAVSNDWAKIIMDRRRSQVCFRYESVVVPMTCLLVAVFTLPWWCSLDQTMQGRRPAAVSIRRAYFTVSSGHYVVAFHQSDRVRMIAFSLEGSARAIDDVISTKWAKVLMDTRRSKVSFQCVSYRDTH